MTPPEPAPPCPTEGCPNRLPSNGYGGWRKRCWTCLKRIQRGQELDEEYPHGQRHEDDWQELLNAAIHLADLKATDDTGWRRARNRLRMAALRYARGRWVPRHPMD